MSTDQTPHTQAISPGGAEQGVLDHRLGRRALLAAATVGTAFMASPLPPAALVAGRTRTSLRHAAEADRLVDTIGVNTHFSWRDTPYAQVDRVVAAIEDLGVRHVRDRITRSPNTRAAFADLAGRGVRVQGICGALGDPETMAQVMSEVAATYPEPARVFSAFEGINEPNNDGVPWIEETRAKTRDLAAQRGAHGLSSIRIVGPALARVNGSGVEGATTQDQSAALGDLSDVLDVGNVHVYPRDQVPSSDIDRFVGYQRLVCGPLPIICSEGGYFTAMNYRGGAWPTPEEVAGIYVPKLVMEHWARGTTRFFLYELMDRYDPVGADRLSSFGVLGVPQADPVAAWRKKPAYRALRNLIRIMSDPGGLHNVGGLPLHLEGPADLRAALFAKRNGAHYLALWRDVASYDAKNRERLDVPRRTVALTFRDSHRVSVFRPTVSARPLRQVAETRSLAIRLSEDLVIVRIR